MRLVAAAMLGSMIFVVVAMPGDVTPRPASLRRPVAAVLLADSHSVAVANSRTGTVSRVDFIDGIVLEELAVGRTLSDLQPVPQTPLLIAVDDTSSEVALLYERDGKLAVKDRHAVCRNPVSVTLSHDGRIASVAGQWSHRLDVVEISRDLNRAPMMRVSRWIDLPFAPRLQCRLRASNHVVVADAFGGRLAVVDTDKPAIIATHQLDAHNIRGLALSDDGKDLFVAHQTLDEHALINWQTVHSGRLMANLVRRIPVAALRDPNAKIEAASELIKAGDTGHGGGDPAGIALLSDDRVAVCLSGVGQMIVINRHQVITERIEAGQHPTALVKLPGGKLLTVNTFGESVSVVDPDAGKVVRHIPLGPSRPLTQLERGEVAFYNARVSHDGWMSCHSCHSDGYTSGLRSDTSGDGTDGAPKRILSLRGTGNINRWAWNGAVNELYDQVRNSMLTSMLSDDLDKGTVADLVAYLESLPPAPARLPATDGAVDRETLARGRAIFLSHNCQSCHVPPLSFSSSDTFDVGLEDENGHRKFKPPSLRGVGHATQFFHDNRAKSLENVFREYAHPSDTSLTEREVADLVRYLRSL